MIPDAFAALEMLDQTPARPKNVELGLWLADFYKEGDFGDTKLLIRLMRWSDLPVPLGYDEEFEQRSLSPAREFLLFEVVQIIEDTPERFQEALAWLLQAYLEANEVTRTQVLAFRKFARSGFTTGETSLLWILSRWRILWLKKLAGLELREIAHIFDLDIHTLTDLEKLAKTAGEPIESASDLWEEWWGEIAVSVAEGYMRLFQVEIPECEEPEEEEWENRWPSSRIYMPNG